MSEKFPFVSVVVPAYNEELMISSCLQALLDQDYKGKYEIIVVDNNSSDRTAKIAEVFGVKVLREPRQGVAFARQKGFDEAKGEIIFSTDADTIVSPNWFRRMVEEFQKDPKIVAIGGGFKFIGANTPLKLFTKTVAPLFFFSDKIISFPGTLIGWNMAVKKETFIKVGGFDLSRRSDEVGEDMDLGIRLKKIGRIKKIFNIKVQTSARRYTGFVRSLKYVLVNYFSFLFSKHVLSGNFQTIRQKPFESYDVVNDAPFFIVILLICFIAIVFLVGIVPSINIWSTSSVTTKNKVIALTFDMYNNNVDTNQILQVLKQENVNATFFITGNDAKSNPALVKKIFTVGNQIGNHASSQNSLSMLKTPSALVADINLTDNLIYKDIGVRPDFFRPTRGYRTIWGALSLSKYGYNIVTWSVSGGNTSGISDSKTIAINVIKNAKPGAIIDLPDNGSLTAQATEEIIDLLTADGYKFVTLDKLLKKPAYFNPSPAL